MTVDANREKFLNIIEGQGVIEGRFSNLRRLGPDGGGGAFSLLFQADDTSNAKAKVALKYLYPFERDAYRRQCFDRESEVLKKLAGQKDIIQLVSPKSEYVYTVGPLDIPFSYYAVEMADTDLGSLIEASALNARDNLLYFRMMCRSVKRLHSLWIAHRDIKPPNFLVMGDGSIKLSDFGTARILDGSTPGILADYAQFPPGDLGYVAPEMLASLHDDDPQIALGADVFSLAACLFEMFAGVPLGVQLFDQSFQMDLMQAMAAIKRGQRVRTYEQFVTSMANAHHLPSMAAFSPDVPRSIRHQLDELYRSMAAIDYRQRLKDFEHIFLKINRCLLTLENQEKVRRWRENRDLRHNALVEKRQQRMCSVGIRSIK